MSHTLDESGIDQRTSALTELRERLSTTLVQAAEHLHAAGAPPGAALLRDLGEYARQLRSLFESLGSDTAIIDSFETSPPRLSLDDILMDWEHRQHVRAAQEIVQHVLELTYPDDSGGAVLQPCHTAARELRDSLSSGAVLAALPDVVTELSRGTHPLCAVVRLAEHGDQLSDADWATLQELVASHYGRGLTTALARGKITRRNPDATSTSPAFHTAAAETSSNDSRDADDDAQPSEDGLIFDTPPPPPKLSLPRMEADPACVTVPVVASAATTRTAPPSETPLDESDRAVIKLAVLRLIREERFAIAAHLLETEARLQRDCDVPVPAALLRACALVQQLCYPRGEIAARLDQELRSIASVVKNAAADEATFGVGLMMRAACLPAALLGASPAAIALLRSFPIEPGTSRLYNFGNRVIAFGERMQGFAAELFHSSPDGTAWKQDEDQLAQEIRSWMEQSPSRAVEYARASPLFVHAHWTVTTRAAQREPELVDAWVRWQETLLAAHRLLKPARDGLQGERSSVRQEVTRITALLERNGAGGSTTPEKRSPPPLNDAMQETLREALVLAQRWLRLQTTAPQRPSSLPPQAVEELRSELLERADQVDEELQALLRDHPSPWAAVGILTCRRAVAHIRELCKGTQTLPQQELDPRHVLDAVLLKVADLELDNQWQPVADSPAVRQALLAHVHDHDPSWRAAFELQSAQADHLATLRLLELPVWRDEDERGVLRQLRSTRLEICRRNAREDLSEWMSQVHLTAEQQPDLRPECEEWLRRAEQLLVTIPRLLSFARLRAQIDALRVVWMRLRAGETRRHLSTTSNPAVVRLPGDSKLLAAAGDAEPEQPPTSAEAWVFGGD